MPLTDFECPNCGGFLHTDDLLKMECVTPGCGHELDAEWYEERPINGFYVPEEVNPDA